MASTLVKCFNFLMKKTHWYQQRKLKQVSAFLTKNEKEALVTLAKKEDKSLARYVTRLIQRHLTEATKLKDIARRPPTP